MTSLRVEYKLNKPYVIFAPHIDDEVIGCFRFLLDNLVDTVYFFYECTDIRKQEAINLSKEFGFNCVFDCIIESPIVPCDKIILVPNCRDHHEHHRAVNKLSRCYKNTLKFYSVDMNVRKDVLPFEVRYKKQSTLNTFYPSQASLLSDEKYHLFESIVDDDLDIVYTSTVVKCDISYTLECDIDYSSYEFEKTLARIGVHHLSGSTINHIIKDLIYIEALSKCSFITVTMKHNSSVIDKSITKTIYL